MANQSTRSIQSASNYSQLLNHSQNTLADRTEASTKIFEPKHRYINRILLEHLIHRGYTSSYEVLEQTLESQETKITNSIGIEEKLTNLKEDLFKVTKKFNKSI